MRVLGIDEAGRGCVLGPLVVASFLAVDVDDAVLVAAGARDSKQIAPRRREQARAALSLLGTGSVRRIPATAIDAGNLNSLEEDAIVDLVREARPDAVLVDALGPPAAIPAVIARLAARVGLVVAWTMEPKADATFPAVGAASIFAKTTRDAALDEIRAAWGEVGSGYPSDPVTRRWLEARAAARQGWPDFVRTRWETVQALAQERLFR